MGSDNTEDINAEKTAENQRVIGRPFPKGVSGNPNGRPKGSGLSITTEIKKKLEECPDGQKATYLQLLINRILKQAIQDGDQQMITKIWNYVDGMPKQSTELTGKDGEKVTFIIKRENSNNESD